MDTIAITKIYPYSATIKISKELDVNNHDLQNSKVFDLENTDCDNSSEW